MGTWDADAFGNDCAMDWLAEFERNGGTAVIEALSSASSFPATEYMDVHVGETAVAAAELVASAYGQGSADLSEYVEEILALHAADIRATPGVKGMARAAIARVMAEENSELYDLWKDTGKTPEKFFNNMDDLKRRLS